MSNVALLYRLRRCGDWLTMLVGRTLALDAPKAAQGRLTRLIDATTVPKAGTQARMQTSCGAFIVLSTCQANVSVF
jgi:hypothetical protein